MLKTKTVAVEAKDDGLYVKFEGEGVSPEPVKYDMILQAAGRTPNGKKIGADKAGVAVTDRGFINVDAQMRTNVPHIFAIGDIVGQPMLAHKAVHEAHVAAEVAAGQKSAFDASVIPASPTPIRKSRGSASPKTRPRRTAARSKPPSSRGRPPVAPLPTAPITASPS
jgi:dihydrolipoamide dehydrogenase